MCIRDSAYPELREKEEYIKKLIRTEEERFAATVESGLVKLDEMIAALRGNGDTPVSYTHLDVYKRQFLDWLFDFEYNKLGLPAPTLVFFLDMPANLTFQLLRKRQGNEGDIHEKDHEYLSRCREGALEICRRYGWQIISCAPEGTPLTVEQIHEKIWEQVRHRLEQAGQ